MLYEYNHWANAQTLTAVSPLNPGQFAQNLSSSFPSVRDTLVHILGAEWIWLERWRGVSPPALLNAQDFPTLEIIKARWSEVERERNDFINQLTDESLSRRIAYLNTKGQRWEYALGQMLQHVVNHSTYHRGQITTMLRQLGQKPASTDFLLHLDEK
ncbi:MAG: DinB family protein [bacterium]